MWGRNRPRVGVGVQDKPGDPCLCVWGWGDGGQKGMALVSGQRADSRKAICVRAKYSKIIYTIWFKCFFAVNIDITINFMLWDIVMNQKMDA